MNRRKVFAAGIAVVLLGALAFAAGTRIESPGDALDDAAPPRPSVLLATVKSGSLQADLAVTGKIEWGRRFTIRPPADEGGGGQVVTRLGRKAGSVVQPGDVLLEIGDRPLIALPGRVPLLHDLVPGATGPDVVRLQRALQSAGYSIHDVDGRLGSSTMSAFEALYRAAGYPVPAVEPSAPSGASDSGGADSEGLGAELPTQVPGVASKELVLVPRFPLRVLSVDAVLGGEVGEGIALVPVRPVVRAEVTSADSAAVRVGRMVQITFSQGRSAPARIRSVGPPEEIDDRGMVRLVTLAPTSVVRPQQVGESVQIAFNGEREAARGLLVPLSALYDSADRGVIVRVRARGVSTAVAVTVLQTAGGTALVEARESARLAAGDRVVVGLGR